MLKIIKFLHLLNLILKMQSQLNLNLFIHHHKPKECQFQPHKYPLNRFIPHKESHKLIILPNILLK